jgi:hypothetical protein
MTTVSRAPSQGKNQGTTAANPKSAACFELLSALRLATAAAERLCALEDAVPDEIATDLDRDPPRVAGLALLSDGRAALSITHFDGVDLPRQERETWTGVILSVAETSDALERLSEAADEAAGHVAGHILFVSKKRDEEDNGDE